MHRFYAENLNTADKEIVITGDDVNHIKNVLRLKPGDEIVISDGRSRDYYCTITELNNDFVTADITDICSNKAELPVEITLFQGLPKSDKMDFIIQKAVELGAVNIVPVITSRTVVKTDKKKEEKKLQRYNLIAEAAAKQSGRGIVPKVKEFMSFKEAIKLAETMDMILIPYEEAEGMDYSKKIISEIKEKSSIGIFIGPEGGFARDEIDYAMSKGAKIITLGKRILRTETAGLAILSIIMFELEN